MSDMGIDRMVGRVWLCVDALGTQNSKVTYHMHLASWGLSWY